MSSLIITVLPPGAAHRSSTRSPGWASTASGTSCDASSCTRNCSWLPCRSGLPETTRSPCGASAVFSHSTSFTASAFRTSSRVARSRLTLNVRGAGSLLNCTHFSVRSKPYAIEPPCHEPVRMRPAHSEIEQRRLAIGGIVRARRQRQTVALAECRSQNGVDEARCALLARRPRQAHRIVDDRS